MDLSSIDVPDEAVIHIEHPTMGKLYQDQEKTKPCTITVAGPASDVAVVYRKKAQKRLFDRMGKKGIKALNSIPPDELEDNSIERLQAMTLYVSGLEMHGEPVTPKNVDRLYRDPRFGWLRDQVEEKLGSWEDFLS